MRNILEYFADLAWRLESGFVSVALFGEYEYPSEKAES